MNRRIATPPELPPEATSHPGVYPLPARATSDRYSFLTILKLREIKRRKRRAPEAE